jgi:hypothetical protein
MANERDTEDKVDKISRVLKYNKHSFFMTEKEKHIHHWIHQVSIIRPELNHFAVCPFAAKSKFKIDECSIEDLYVNDLYDVLIFIVEDFLDLNAINLWVSHYNQIYEDWKFFEDCATEDTYINGIQTNNGRYNLILCQPSKKLRLSRQHLIKTNYYKAWDSEYLKKILEDDYDLVELRDRNPVKSSDSINQEKNNDQTSR